MDQSILQQLAQLGLPGIALIVIGMAYKAKDKKCDDLQELRVTEAKQSITAIEKNTAAFVTLTEVLKQKSE